jgi:hypothetical protein
MQTLSTIKKTEVNEAIQSSNAIEGLLEKGIRHSSGIRLR